MKNYELFDTSDLQEWYDKHVTDDILIALEEFQERDSGWALSRILNLIVNVNKYNPMHAGGGAARNYAQENDNQCAFDGQCMFHLVGGHRSVTS